MEWCVDTRNAGSVSVLEQEIAEHLEHHAIEPAVVELARPLVIRALTDSRPGVLWVTLDWDDTMGRMLVRHLPDGPLPGEEVAPGVTRAHEQAAALYRDHAGSPALTLDLGVARPPERDIDLPPADPGLVPEDQPVQLLGLVAAEIGSGRSLEEAASRAGATVAERIAAGGAPAGGPDAVADALIAAEAVIGGQFEKVAVDGGRVVMRNRRCPFGPATSPAMCRFTSALAGGLGARSAGAAEVTVAESLADGDRECRVVIDLGGSGGHRTGHSYKWPPVIPDGRSGGEVRDVRGFQVTLSLQLPRDRLSVPVTRHLVRAAMQEVGVVADDGHAVELAVTEACANVIDHSGPGDAYDVSVTISPTACHIRVVDVGRGFDHQALSTPQMAGHDAEHGRGLALMHALVDQVRFESEPERGTVVHLVKLLTFDESSTARRLMREAARNAEAAGGAGA